MQMMHRRHRRNGLLMSVAVFAVVVVITVWLIAGMERRVDEEQTVRLEEALSRAAVTCYAVEGRYPPTLEYLMDAYGVAVDFDHFMVDYMTINQNSMPFITVTWIEGAAG